MLGYPNLLVVPYLQAVLAVLKHTGLPGSNLRFMQAHAQRLMLEPLEKDHLMPTTKMVFRP